MQLGLVAFGLGPAEIVVVLLLVLLLFGPSKLPQLGEGIGKMLRGFKKEMKALDDEGSQTAAQANAAEPDHEIDVTPKPKPEKEAATRAS